MKELAGVPRVQVFFQLAVGPTPFAEGSAAGSAATWYSFAASGKQEIARASIFRNSGGLAERSVPHAARKTESRKRFR
ncbi:MAG: hypothetical protein ABSG21_06350 [Spirochaetia bacterium]